MCSAEAISDGAAYECTISRCGRGREAGGPQSRSGSILKSKRDEEGQSHAESALVVDPIINDPNLYIGQLADELTCAGVREGESNESILKRFRGRSQRASHHGNGGEE